ncbi:MAG: hypothetical protein P4L99_10605 [Chthoniobacter sp.]|nr:hypothetical protein [Chthoniobacter sp.]
MKRITVPAALALTLAIFSACVDDQPKKKPKSGFHPPSSDTTVASNPSPDDNANPDTKPPTDNKPPADNKPQPPAVPESAPVKVGEIPYAKPVPGKPGFVFSPYDQYKGYIDVRGFPPGTEVKDPYSGKSFLVP